jgi:hypothetical protein
MLNHILVHAIDKYGKKKNYNREKNKSKGPMKMI